MSLRVQLLKGHSTRCGYLPGQRAGSEGPCAGAHGTATLTGGLHQGQTVVRGFGCCNWLRSGG